jgi:hypothetical protein
MDSAKVIQEAEAAQDADRYEDARVLLAQASSAAPEDVDLLVALAKATRLCERFGGSCPYSCVEAIFLGGKKRRESLRVVDQRRTLP